MQADRKNPEPFLGSWSLVSFEHVLPSGDVLMPFGDSPAGLILYQQDGHVSAQLSVRSPVRFTSEDSDRASVEESAEAWRTYFGYWGTFKVDAENGLIVHCVEGCSFPNWIGTQQIRHFRFDDENRLVLETPSSSGRFVLIWQRKLA